MTIALICPHDHGELLERATFFECGFCARKFHIVDGVVGTLDRPDDFYEGAYQNQTHYQPRSERWWHAWPLWLINSGYLWTVRKHVPKGAVVVELGCAGGIRYFGQHYRMVGCDLSHASLKILDFYERRIQADAASCIALPDGSVDAVVSSYFWEHIPKQTKPLILKECHRVLRPGGKLIFLYDVETNNPLIGRLKRSDPGLYKTLFIDGDGHLGYQSPQENVAAFEGNGFEIVDHQAMEKTWLQSPSVYEKLSHFRSWASPIFGKLHVLGKQPLIYPYIALTRLVDNWLGPWLPTSWARISMVVVKRGN